MAKKTPAITIQLEKKPKGKPRGNPDATIPYRRKKGDPPLPGAGRPKRSEVVKCSSKLISEGYKVRLEEPIPDWACEVLGLEKGTTGAGALASLQLMGALGLGTPPREECVRELREVTEGKLPDKQELGGPNGTPLPTATPTFNVQFAEPKKEGEQS